MRASAANINAIAAATNQSNLVRAPSGRLLRSLRPLSFTHLETARPPSRFRARVFASLSLTDEPASPMLRRQQAQRAGDAAASRTHWPVAPAKAGYKENTAGRERARQDKTEHVVHNQDGVISERNSYGNDPASRPG
jgi:hypothetical protein